MVRHGRTEMFESEETAIVSYDVPGIGDRRACESDCCAGNDAIIHIDNRPDDRSSLRFWRGD